MEDEVIFIDQDGNRIYSDTISSHIGLGQLLIEKDENLKEEYEKSGKKDIVDFLVMDKGYLKVSTMGRYYKVVTFASSHLTGKQKRLLGYYAEEGYRFDNLSNLNLSKEKINNER